MHNNHATKRVQLHEAISHDGMLIFAEPGLTLSAELIDGQIRIAIHTLADRTLVAQTAILLPQPTPTNPDDPAYPGGVYYPI